MKKIALFFLTLSFACAAQERQPIAAVTMTPELMQQLIDSLSKDLLTNYVYADKAQLMAKYLQGQSAKGTYRVLKDPQALAAQISADLQTACPDPHLAVHFVPELAHMASPPRHAPDPREDSLRNLLMEKGNFMFTSAEILPDNIGYVKIDGFMDNIAAAKETVTAAFRFLRYTDGLIIDVRQNHGGSPMMVKQVESYFFPDKTRMNDIIIPGQHQTLEGWTDPTATDGLVLPMQVCVLTSGNTFSAAEDFAYGMQASKRAIIAGEKTGGGAHPVRPFFLGNGFVAEIPFARSYNVHTGRDWEGTGVVPDIALKADASLDEIRAILFPHKDDPETLNRKAWLENQQKAVDRPLDPSAIQPFLGTYTGGLKFYLKENFLYCENPERGNQVFKLRYIGPGFFQLDENVQVKFGQEQGAVSGIHFFWSNGAVSFRQKTQ